MICNVERVSSFGMTPNVTYRASHGIPIDEEVLKKNAATALTDLCCSGKVLEWNRAKWMGYEIALDCWLQNHVINNIGFHTWEWLMVKLGYQKKPSSITRAARSSNDVIAGEDVSSANVRANSDASTNTSISMYHSTRVVGRPVSHPKIVCLPKALQAVQARYSCS